MSSELTEEQRMRIQKNRRLALERKQSKQLRANSGSMGGDAISTVATGSNKKFYNCNQYGRNFKNEQGNDKSPRESFGDSNIDWEAAVSDMDRIIAGSRQSNTRSSGAVQRISTNAYVEGADIRKRKLENGNSSDTVPSNDNHQCCDSNDSGKQRPILCEQKNNQLTEEQRARIEENRRKALERKLQADTSKSKTNTSQTQNLQPVHQHSIQSATSQNQQRNSLTEEQRALIERNRQRALEKKKAEKITPQQQQQQTSILTNNSNTTTSSHPMQIELPADSGNNLTEAQRIRIEENKRQALGRKQKPCFQATPQLGNNVVLPSTGVRPLLQPTHVNNKNATTSLLQSIERTLKKDSKSPTQDINQSAKVEAPHDNINDNNTNDNITLGRVDGDEKLGRCAEKHSLTDDQRARMEQNRLLALEKRKRKQSTSENASILPPGSNLAEIVMNGCNRPNPTEFHRLDGKAEEIMKQPNVTRVESSASSSPRTEAEGEDSKLPKLPEELQYEEARILPIDDDRLETLIENAELDEPLKNGWTLFEHQKEGVLRALNMRRLILAFDMGLGKTIIGCVWAKAFLKSFDDVTIFVIAPVSLHQEWRRTAEEATGLNVDKGENAKKKKKREKKKTSDSDDDDDDDEDDSSLARIDMHIFSWSSISAHKKVMENISEYVVICDEAHNMQSMASKRTEEVLKLVFPKRCVGVLLLTGTPMKNGRPSNLFPLLKACKHPFADHQKRFEFYFCNGQQKCFSRGNVWDASGSSNLKELNAHTASHIFRKTKEECMSKELPPKNREYHRIVVCSRHELRYSQALKELARAYTLSKSMEIGGGDSDDILAPFNKLRQISSTAKIDGTVALANEILLKESSIVIFTAFVAVAKEIYQRLHDMCWDGEVLTGETVAHKRQTMVDRFQSGLSPVFVCTYGAGGVGLTLTAACTVLLVDRPWTPGEVLQAEDRVRRIGQTRSVRSIWIKSFPIDDQIDELIDHKEDKSSVAVDGKEVLSSRNSAAPKISISELVKSVIGNEGSKM